MSQVEAVSQDVGNATHRSLLEFAIAAVGHSVGVSRLQAEDRPENAYLLQALASTDSEFGWHAALRNYLDKPNDLDRPLVALARRLELCLAETVAVSLAAAVERDLMPGRVLAYVQAPLSGSRPTLGLVATAINQLLIGSDAFDEILTGNAVTSGLLQLRGDGQPFPERQFSVPSHLCLALRGKDCQVPATCIELDVDATIPFPDSILQEAQHLGGTLRSSSRTTLVVRSVSMAEAKSLADVICQSLGRRPLFLDGELPAGLGPWLLLRKLLPVYCCTLAPGERKKIDPISGYDGVRLVLCGSDGTIDVPGASVANWCVTTPKKEERRQLWMQALGDDELADELSEQHRHHCDRIAQLARLAHFEQKLAGHILPTADDIYKASWSGTAGELDALAQPLRDPVPDDAFIASSVVRRDLEALRARCCARDCLADELGISALTRYQPGVRALFVGPSGTGKTLAAGWLATKLRLPLYRVDLASVSSKYIGETEKNLSQLFALAEQTEVILLFDEADSLFGKRTDVEHANDRFANAQTNYMLQRIECFDGITILTSNSRSRFDPAFVRRLDLIIEFPIQTAEDRRKLWRSHLGTGVQLLPGQLSRLAALADLPGGHIRNVVLAAAAAASEQRRAIEYRDLIAGLELEYRKIGRQMPVDL